MYTLYNSTVSKPEDSSPLGCDTASSLSRILKGTTILGERGTTQPTTQCHVQDT